MTQIVGVSAMAAVVFEAISFARAARQAASAVLEQVAEVTGSGADSARDIIRVFGKLGQLLSEAADL
eukprot:1874764-Alexandrium_andersonii.AAC.1